MSRCEGRVISRYQHELDAPVLLVKEGPAQLGPLLERSTVRDDRRLSVQSLECQETAMSAKRHFAMSPVLPPAMGWELAKCCFDLLIAAAGPGNAFLDQDLNQVRARIWSPIGASARTTRAAG
jgi:hypothetical protein